MNCENQLLHKQIPINIGPYIHSQYDNLDTKQYTNPFAAGSKGVPPFTGRHQSTLQAPLIIDDLISDTSSDIYSESKIYAGPARRYEPVQRSEGEIGLPSDQTSAGEVKPSKKITKPSKGQSVQLNKDLGQTYNYDEDRFANDIDEKPVYDSSEGPVPKGGKQVRGGKTADVFVSGDSFGARRLQAKTNQKQLGKRDTIGENFLEEDDGASSGLAESGEIDPRLFK